MEAPLRQMHQPVTTVQRQFPLELVVQLAKRQALQSGAGTSPMAALLSVWSASANGLAVLTQKNTLSYGVFFDRGTLNYKATACR